MMYLRIALTFAVLLWCLSYAAAEEATTVPDLPSVPAPLADNTGDPLPDDPLTQVTPAPPAPYQSMPLPNLPGMPPRPNRVPAPVVIRPHFDKKGRPRLAVLQPTALSIAREGQLLLLKWDTSGSIAYVRLSYHGELCALGGHSRGMFGENVARFLNRGQYRWRVPWMDGATFHLRLVGYGTDGHELASTEVGLRLLPKVCQEVSDKTCVVVSKAHQRLYYLREGQIVRMHVVSTAAAGYTTPNMKPGSHGRGRGEMGRVFGKAPAPFSKMYQVVMRYWLGITASGSHGLHATSPALYRLLGRPASHGCVRQHLSDARTLYQMVTVGTPVYIM